ncbi:unnamed protein product [Prunus armeniaca]
MVRLKFLITPFSLCSQSNPTPKTCSLMPLMFFKFDFTSSLTEIAANHLNICYRCGGGCGRDDAFSSGGGMALFGLMTNYGDVDY